MMKKQLTLILGCLLLSINLIAQEDPICHCYSEVKTSDANDPAYLNCLETHRKTVQACDDSLMQLMRKGKRPDNMDKINAKMENWKECFKPEMKEVNSFVEYQFKDHLGKEVELFFDVDFTSFNEFNETGYLEINFANYDPVNTWERPENAFSGTITILLKDSVSSPQVFTPKTYQVNRNDGANEYFYISYHYLDYKYHGGSYNAKPNESSTLTIIENNGRYIELEFTHTNEDGDIVSGTFQCIYPFTQFD